MSIEVINDVWCICPSFQGANCVMIMEEWDQIRPRDEATEKIESYIRKSGLKPGEKLISEREMCKMWNMNRSTLRSAIKRLLEEGVLYNTERSGTYLCPAKLDRNLQDVKSTSESARRGGYVLTNRVLTMKIIESDKYLSKKLQLTLGHKIFNLRRLRVLNDEPYMIEESYVNYELCKGIESHNFAEESLYDVLKQYDSPVVKGQEIVGVTFATEEEASFLQVKKECALFYLSGLGFDKKDLPIEYFKSVVRADKVRFSSILKKHVGNS
jgi:GntR family transcriptional regulator